MGERKIWALFLLVALLVAQSSLVSVAAPSAPEGSVSEAATRASETGSTTRFGRAADSPQREPDDVFTPRRKRLMEQIGDGIALFHSAPVAHRNGDVEYEYRQDSDFYYLTGFTEPDSAFLLVPGGEQQFVLFVRARDALQEAISGRRHGIEGARRATGADAVYPRSRLTEMLPQYMHGRDTIYYGFGDDELGRAVIDLIRSPLENRHWPVHIVNPDKLVLEMRRVKDSTEIALLRRAVEITAAAHLAAMRFVTPGVYEYEVEATIEYVFRKSGATHTAFPSIVGSGPNATLLHYQTNTRQARAHELLLIDIGAEYEHYAADVTRTIPVSGRYTEAQRQIYELVLRAQSEGIDMIGPGVDLLDVHNHVNAVLAAGLHALGLVLDPGSEWQRQTWSVHGISHWLGLDVHDASDYRAATYVDAAGRLLEPGMVLTVEPGLYFGELNAQILRQTHSPDVGEEEIEAFLATVEEAVERFRDIGVRIEDDVLVTATGHEVLSARVPKRIEEIEAIMRERQPASLPTDGAASPDTVH